MQENLLNSVIKITKNRDVDSLEYSLISTIQEFIGCKEISVYKDIEVQGQLSIEQSLSLKVTGEKQFEWTQRQLVTHPEDELISCLRSACIITVQSTDGIERRWLPITRQEKTVAAIFVVSNSLDSSAQVMLNAFSALWKKT